MTTTNRFKERAKQITSDVLSAPFRAIEGYKGATADADRKAVRLARETKGVKVDPVAAAEGDKFSQDVIMARGRAAKVKADAAKRKK